MCVCVYVRKENFRWEGKCLRTRLEFPPARIILPPRIIRDQLGACTVYRSYFVTRVAPADAIIEPRGRLGARFFFLPPLPPPPFSRSRICCAIMKCFGRIISYIRRRGLGKTLSRTVRERRPRDFQARLYIPRPLCNFALIPLAARGEENIIPRANRNVIFLSITDASLD